MIIKVELRCVFVAAYFVKTGYCSVNQIALWFGERKSHIARRKQQESEEVKKTPVRINEKESEHFTVFVSSSFIDRKTKATAYLHHWISINEQQISSWLYTDSSIQFCSSRSGTVLVLDTCYCWNRRERQTNSEHALTGETCKMQIYLI